MAKIESDEALVRRFRAGDDSAFDLLCERYRKSVYTSCYAILLGETPATDVASQTFAEALRELRRGQVPDDPRMWLRAKAQKLAMDRADPRMERRSRSVELDPEWQAVTGDSGQLIWDAVTSLALSHRKVLSLRIPLELDAPEIATVFAIDSTRAQRLLDDAERELRKALIGLVVARSGRRECAALDGLLTAAGWTAGHFPAESGTYRTVAEHVDNCDTCVDIRARDYNPAEWLHIVIPLLALPPELIRRLVEEMQDLAVRTATGPATTSSSALASTGASLGQPIGRLAQLGQGARTVATTTATRVATSPIVTRAVQTAHEHPALTKIASVAAAAVLFGPMMVASDPDPDVPGGGGPGGGSAGPPGTSAPADQPSPGAASPPDASEPAPATQNPFSQVAARGQPAAPSQPIFGGSPDIPPSQPAGPTDPIDPGGPIGPPDPGGPTGPPDTGGPTGPPDTGGPTNPPDTGGPTEPPDTGGPTNPPDTGGPGPDPLDQPPKWGYAYNSAAYSAIGTQTALTTPGRHWGTWMLDRARAARVPVVTHEATGVYLFRFPTVGSTRAIAHVTAAWYPYSAHCVVRDNESSGGDQLIRVACFNAAGTPTDMPHDVSFAEPSRDTTPMAAVRYDLPGGTASADPLRNDGTANTTRGEVRVRRDGTGRYTAILDGAEFLATGYAQITPRTDKPVHCHNAGLRTVGSSLHIDVRCYAAAAAEVPADTEWQLSFVQGAPLAHDNRVLGAYAQTTLTAPGLRIDPDRSYNPGDGAMTVLRDGIGNYLVGLRGVATAGNLFHAIMIGPGRGSCTAQGWWNTAPNEVWARVVCYAGGLAVDRPFGLALLRGPGELTAPLHPTPPGPHPAGPLWAHARVGLATYLVPHGIETELDPDEQWGTWVGDLPRPEARWARRATVVHDGVGRYRLTLPGAGSPTGIPHVSTSWSLSPADSCTVLGYRQVPRGGHIDEEISVGCVNGAPGRPVVPKDVPFTVFFGAPNSGGTPAATIRYDGAGDADPRVRHNGTGDYTAIVDGPGFDGTGHVQVTPLTPDGPSPIWCHATETEPTMRIHVRCWDFSRGPARPADARWLLTYVQGSPLTHDPAVPGAYLRTTLTPPTRPAPGVDTAYSSTGGVTAIRRIDTGQYWVGLKAVGNGGNTLQFNVIGPAAGTCSDVAGPWYPTVGEMWVQVVCHDANRSRADLPFSAAVLRSPYGDIGTRGVADPGPAAPGPRWGYAIMNAIDSQVGVETGLAPGGQWGTWHGTLQANAMWWLAQSTVVRERTGESLVRLPNIGSTKGIPHVTVYKSAAHGETCVVRDFWLEGNDERIRVACFDSAGKPKDVRFLVFFGEPNTGEQPMLGVRSDSPDETVRITRLGPGRYRLIAEGQGFSGTGYAQITPLGQGPAWCQNLETGLDGGNLRVDVNCFRPGGAAADTDWLLSYVQHSSLTQDTRQPGAYAQTTLDPAALTIDGDRSYTSSGGPITLTRLGTGYHRLRLAGIARPTDPLTHFGHSVQAVTLGPVAGYCRVPLLGRQDWYGNRAVAEVEVICYDSSGTRADIPFGVAVVRRT